ncbi:MAG: N-acetylmuramoyl-L-alanine amidase [Elusimicrobia bacterium]|nr:N-acetylmuramoyl-L-alanine amidase [Elusimicrobiota bacterium]
MKRLMRRWAGGLLISFAALPLFAQGRRPPWPAASVNTVVDGNVRTGVQVFTIEENPCLSLRTIKQVFGGRVQWKRVSRRIVYLSEGRTAEFTLDVSTAVVGGKALPLATPPRAWGSDVFLPVSLLVTPEFQSLVASQVQWNAARRNLTVDPSPAVSSPRFYSYPNKSRLTIDIGPHVDYRVLAHRDNILTLRFYGGRAREWEKVSVDDGAIASVEVDPRARTTDVIVTLGAGTADPAIYLEESPRSVVVEVLRAGAPGKPGSASTPKTAQRPPRPGTPALPPPELSPPDRARPRADIDAPYLALSPIRTIVIDPGHGGKDVGAVGPNGTLEKDVNLQIGLALAKLLNKEGRFKVILTRANDSFVTLQDRSSMANKAKADLFISLHCNAGLKRESGGFEVYFLSEKATNDEAAAVARRENAVVELEGVAGKAREELEGLLWSLARNEHMNDSSAIAVHIDRQITKRLSIGNRGVKQAGFYVLRGTSMPAILVESAFITHPKEEGLLRSSRFHVKLVDALYAGLLDYEKQRINARLGKTSAGGN